MENGHIRNRYWNTKNDPLIFYLMFANDCLIFYRTNKNVVRNMTVVMKITAKCLVNIHKSRSNL